MYEEPRIRARAYAGKRAKVVVGMEKTFCRTFRIGLGLALREGKKDNTKYTKQYKTTQLQTMAHAHTCTHTNDKHTRNRTRYNAMQIYMKIFVTSK